MSQSGFGLGVSQDERPIMGRVDSRDWVGSLCDYVTSMKELNPGDPCHPLDDWLNQCFAMILLDQV